MASIGAKINDIPETTAFGERRLRDGTLIQYRLSVIQQPQRARACGMGAKAHADRRPVDPPPVVDLRIFSGEDHKNDITFSHNSNFFLYATLEPARPMAQGRGMGAPASPAVLTGVPVSGMAYLDRPYPGGYFIFPDLSVRHEGNYRLLFSLFEEAKSDGSNANPSDPEAPEDYIHHRVQVKSQPFTVFSAKKFPGLAESTALSRTVAEQGCRVRIRRDVRMRKRTEKHSGRDIDEDETASFRAKRQASPETYQPAPMQPQPDRKRSDSMASSAPMNQSFNNGYHAPMPSSSYQDYNARPRSPVSSRPVPQQSQNPFSVPAQIEQAPQHMRRQSNDFYGRRDSEYRQPPVQQTQHRAPPTQQQYQAQISSYQPQYMSQQQPQYQPAMQQPKYEQPAQRESGAPVRLPPLEPKWRQETTSAPLASPRPYADLQNHIKAKDMSMEHAASPHVKSYSPQTPLVATETTGNKRAWGSVFNEAPVAARLSNGMRPSNEGYGDDAEDDDDDILGLPMFYRRADGVQVQRSFAQFNRPQRRS